MKPTQIGVILKLIKHDSLKSLAELGVFDAFNKPINLFTTDRGLLTNRKDILEKDIPTLLDRVRDEILKITGEVD